MTIQTSTTMPDRIVPIHPVTMPPVARLSLFASPAAAARLALFPTMIAAMPEKNPHRTRLAMPRTSDQTARLFLGGAGAYA